VGIGILRTCIAIDNKTIRLIRLVEFQAPDRIGLMYECAELFDREENGLGQLSRINTQEEHARHAVSSGRRPQPCQDFTPPPPRFAQRIRSFSSIAGDDSQRGKTREKTRAFLYALLRIMWSLNVLILAAGYATSLSDDPDTQSETDTRVGHGQPDHRMVRWTILAGIPIWKR